MKTYKITGPDGKEYSIDGPEGATREQVIAKIKERLQQTPQDAPQQIKPSSNRSLAARLLNSPIGGALRGLRDPIDAGAQMLTRGLESIAPAGSKFEQFMKSERQRVDNISNAAEKDYRQNWRGGEDPGLDLGRVAGNIAGTLPVAMAIPGAAATAIPARVGYGAAVGGATAAMNPVNTNQDDFTEKKLEQVGIGAAFGAVSPFIADAVSKIFTKFKPQQVQDVTQKISGEFEARGIDFSKISDEVKKSLLDDVTNALKANKDLDYDALIKKADFESLGIKPTLGQITRDPMQYAFERNTSGIAGAGDDLSNRFAEQNKGLIDSLNKAPQASMDRYGAGKEIIDQLGAVDASRRANVSSLYDTARNAAGIHTQLQPGNFAQSVNNALDDAMLGDALPSGVRSTLKKIAVGELPFTIQKAEQIRQAINGQITNIPSRENTALKIVNDALQTAIDANGSATGAAAAEAFKTARKAASERFSKIEASAPLKAVIDGIEPDKFVQKYILNGNAKDVLTLRANLDSNPNLWNEIRGQVVNYLKVDKALNSANDEFGKFSQSAYNKALKQIGDAKLKILFSPDEIDYLKRIGRVAAAIQVQPVGSVVNNSGTSQAIANLLSRASNIPYVKELAINPLMNYRLQSQVSSALNPSVPSTALPPELARMLTLPIAMSGYPLLQDRRN